MGKIKRLFFARAVHYNGQGGSPSDCETTKKAPVDLRPVLESLGSELPIAEEFCVRCSTKKKLCAFCAGRSGWVSVGEYRKSQTAHQTKQ